MDTGIQLRDDVIHRLEHNIASQGVKRIGEVQFHENLVTLHICDEVSSRMDRRLSPARGRDADLEWSKERPEPSRCIPIGALGRQPSPYMSDNDGSETPRFLREGDEGASKDLVANLVWTFPSQHQIDEVRHSLEQGSRRLSGIY